MSLIDEALKKARQQVQDQESPRANGAGLSASPFALPHDPQLPPPARRHTLRVVLTFAGLLLVVGAGVVSLAWFKSNHRPQTAQAEAMVTPPPPEVIPEVTPEVTPVIQVAAEPAEPVVATLPQPPAPEAEVTPVTPVEAEPTVIENPITPELLAQVLPLEPPSDPVFAFGPAANTTPEAPEAPKAPKAPEPTTVTVEPQAPPEPAPTHQIIAGKTYVSRVQLDDDASLSLQGVIWSKFNPAALINGRIVRPGDDVERATVVTIQPKKVVLRIEDVEFFLAMP